MSEGIDHVVLDLAVLAGRGLAAPHALDQTFVDLPDQSLGDKRTAVKIPGYQVKGLTVVEEFPLVVRIDVRHVLTGPETFRLFLGQLSPFDVGGVVGLQDQGSCTHLLNPLLG